MKRFLLALAAVAAMCAPQLAPAQAAPPIKTIGVTQQAKNFLDSLATKARTERVETVACASSYAVQGDTLTLLALSPGQYAKADSINVYVHVDSLGQGIPVCPIGVPSIHSHLHPPGIIGPSDTDRNTQRMVGMWALLLIVEKNKWGVSIY